MPILYFLNLSTLISFFGEKVCGSEFFALPLPQKLDRL